MTIITYFNKHLAIYAIAKTFLSSIGFFDINKENFSTCNACKSHINNVIERYKVFIFSVIDRLEYLTRINENNDYYIVCDELGNYIMPGSPDSACKSLYDSFNYALKHDKSALYFHYAPNGYGVTVTQFSAKEMSEQLSKFKKYFD